MTAAATARAIVHRAHTAQTFADLIRLGDRMGVDRNQPLAPYLREWRRRYSWHLALANTAPYRATGRVTTMN